MSTLFIRWSNHPKITGRPSLKGLIQRQLDLNSRHPKEARVSWTIFNGAPPALYKSTTRVATRATLSWRHAMCSRAFRMAKKTNKHTDNAGVVVPVL